MAYGSHSSPSATAIRSADRRSRSVGTCCGPVIEDLANVLTCPHSGFGGGCVELGLEVGGDAEAELGGVRSA